MATSVMDYMESEPTKCQSCCKGVRKTLSFLLSHIGLLSLVVGYVIMGGFIFEELERDNELMVKRNMTLNRYQITEHLWTITKSMDVLSQENWTTEVTDELRSFEKSLIIALKERGWDGNESEDIITWTFAGGLFYSITVITTIGYGHIAPKTAIAKIVTIFYAILGIPLTVLCWSNIGDAMANAFRFCYWRIFCYICTKKDRSRRKKRALRVQRGMSIRYSGSSSRGKSQKRVTRPSQKSADTISDSINSYSFSDPDRSQNTVQLQGEVNQDQVAGPVPASSSTTGNMNTSTSSSAGNVPISLAVPQLQQTQNASDKLSTVTKVARGLGLKRTDHLRHSQKSQKSNGSQGSGEKSQPPNSLGPFSSSANSAPSSPTTPTTPSCTIKAGTPPILVPNRGNRTIISGAQVPGNLSIQCQSSQGNRLDRVPEDDWVEDPYYYEDYISEEEVEDYSTKPVPIWLSVCIVIAYIIGGAYLFQDWEGWSLLDSAYFCFITLTTIGFGDLVPDQKNTDGEIRIALCSLYLLFGIAMICMSFNLVQEEVINSVKGIGKQLGILKDDDDQDDY